MALRWLCIAVVALLSCFSSLLSAQTPGPHPLSEIANQHPTATANQLAKAPWRGHSRILVKLRAAQAEYFRNAMSASNLSLTPENAWSTQVQQFMLRHSTREIRPLYPQLVRAQLQRQVTAQQLASEVQQRFSNRSRRLHAAFAPPDLSRTYVLEMQSRSPEDLVRALNMLRADPAVEFAEEDRAVSICITPDDPFLGSTGTWAQEYGDLWGIHKIGAPAAWSTNAGEGVLVAVVDTGIDATHADIAANLWRNTGEIPGNGVDDDGNGFVDDVGGWNYVTGGDPTDDHGHGTHVSGTIAAAGNNGIGVIGVAWKARIMPVKALDQEGNGYDSALAQAIVYAANNGVDIMNNSWSGFGDSQVVREAVSYAYNMGVVVIAAAGNDSTDANYLSPAKLRQVITVAASTPYDTLALFSNRGGKIDVAAPGYDILSLRASGTSMGTPLDAYYTRASGTSMAAPHVSGVAALILAQHPEYSNEQVRQVLRNAAVDKGDAGFDLQFGYGILSADAAMAITSPLEAIISSPSPSAILDAPVSIQGVARGQGFAYYTLEYGAGTSPSAWTLFKTNTTAVSGELGTFDIAAVPHGKYTVRLTVYNSTGQAFADQVQIVANHITMPSRETLKNGATLSLVGSAVVTGLQNYRIEWVKGISPIDGWQSTGIVLANGGTASVRNGLLATWDSSVATPAQADYYTLRLTVTADTYTDVISTTVYLEPDLISANWPKWVKGMNIQEAELVPVLDATGKTQLAAITQFSPADKLHLFTPDGATEKVADLSPQYSRIRFGQPTAGWMEQDGESVLINGFHGIDVFRSDLSTRTLPMKESDSTISIGSHVQLEDVDGDSQLEAVGFGASWAGDPSTGYLYVWRKNGELLNEHFPIQVADNNIFLGWGTPRVVVGDLEGDGRKELVVLEGTTDSSSTPLLFSSNGTQRSWAAPSLTGIARQMVLADLDHNGKLQTIILTRDGDLHVLEPDGSERPGWPRRQCYPSGFGTIAVGDLNRDGRDEILASNWGLDVFNADGSRFSSAWPLDPDHEIPLNLYGPAVVADVNGDGSPEIILVVLTEHTDLPATDPRYITFELAVYDQNATKLKSWNLFGVHGHVPDSTMNYITVGDFDNDGLTEIAVSCKTNKITSPSDAILYIFRTNARFNAAANNWPMLYRNSRNSPVLQHTTAADTDFSLSTSGEQTIRAGETASFTITVVPQPGPFNFPVTGFACSGLPTGASCSFGTSSVVPGDSSPTVTLSIATTARITAALLHPQQQDPWVLITAFSALAFGLVSIQSANGTRISSRWKGMLFLLILGCGSVVACGGGSGGSNSRPPNTPGSTSGTPAGSYVITVSATGGGAVRHSSTVSLIIK